MRYSRVSIAFAVFWALFLGGLILISVKCFGFCGTRASMSGWCEQMCLKRNYCPHGGE
jgi:hypothetical protein